MEDIIKSKDNKYVKLVRLLKTKKQRDKTSMFIDEGIKNIDFSFNSNYELEFPVVSESFSLKNIEFMDKLEKNSKLKRVFIVKDEIFKNISETVNSQGVIGVFKKLKIKKKDFQNKILILDKLQDPGNVGTIIRTAEAMGMKDIFYTKGTVDIFSPKVVRASMGSIYFVNIFQLEEENEIKLRDLKALGYKIYASSLYNSVSIKSGFNDEKIALVIGNEGNGISNEILEIADKKIKIDMSGKAESLNAAIASGILIYEIMR